MKTTLALLLLSFVVMISCTKKDKKTEGGGKVLQGPAVKYAYPAEVVKSFIQSCEQTSGGNTKFCQCAIRKIQNKMTFHEFIKLDLEVRAGKEPPKDYLALMQSCNTGQ